MGINLGTIKTSNNSKSEKTIGKFQIGTQSPEISQAHYKFMQHEKEQEKQKMLDIFKENGVDTTSIFTTTPEPANFTYYLNQQTPSLYNIKPNEQLNPNEVNLYKNDRMYLKNPMDVHKEAQEKYDENLKKYNQLLNSEQVKNQEKIIVKKYNDTANAYLESQQEKLKGDEIGWWDKTVGNLARNLIPFQQFGSELNINSNGDLYYMPTYKDLKNQKVINSYDDSFWGTVGKVTSGALQESGKLITAAVLNAATLNSGLGTAEYFGDMFLSSYNNTIAEGYTSDQALVYASLGTAAEVLTGKVLGGTTKAIFGTNSSEMSQTISRALSKVIKDHPRIVNLVSNAISEGSEEFIQEFIDKLNRNLVLNEKNKVFSKETLEDAVYSAAVGALTGAASGGLDKNNYSNENTITNSKQEVFIKNGQNVNNNINLNTNNDNFEKLNSNMQQETNVNNNISFENQIDRDINTYDNIQQQVKELQEKREKVKNAKQLAQIDNQINELQQQIKNINANIQTIQENSSTANTNVNNNTLQDNKVLPIKNEINNVQLPGIEKTNYRGSHQIENANSIVDLDLDNIQNKVIEIAGSLSKQDMSDLNKLKKILKNPDADITIYRASPVNELNSGDWVTTDKSYAKNVADNNGGKVYEYTIKPSQLYYPDNVRELPSLHRLSSFQYVENNDSNMNKIRISDDLPIIAKGNIPIKKDYYNKYNNNSELLNAESEIMKNNFDGKINLQNNITELNDINIDEMTLTEKKKKAIEIFNNHHNTNIFENNGNKIAVNNEDIRESISKISNDKRQNSLLEEHFIVFSDLGDIIQEATLSSQNSETKGRSNYNSWNYYIDGLTINGQRYLLEFDVVNRNDGTNHYRVQRLVNLSTKKAASPTAPLVETTKDTASEKTASYIDNTTTNIPKSKVVLPINNNMQQEIKNIPKNPTKESSYEIDKKKTRKDVHNELLNKMGLTTDELSVGKDISSIAYQRTDPIRVNEKVFGYEVGQKINDATINKTKHNEAERIRFLNKERDSIKDLGIKARSKESAAVQKYAEKQYINDKGEVVKYGDIQLASEFPDVNVQNKIKKAAEVLRNKYDKYIDDINSVITDMGYDPIHKRQDYMKHFNELSDKLSQWGIPLNRNSLKEDALPTDINGITDQFKPGKNWFASAMERKGMKTTYDAITGIDSYLDGASNLIYHTEDIQRYRALSKLIRDTYGQTHGFDNIDLDTKEGQQRLNDIYDNKLSKYVAWLDEQANSLAGKKGAIDRGAERVLGRKLYGILETAKKQVGSNMTGFNVRSALTNFASAVQGVSKTNKLAFIKGTLSTVQNMIHNDGLIEKSDFLTSRLRNDSQLSKKLWQKASNAGQILMTGTDYFTANQIWRGKYFENLQKGMTETESIKKADDFASRIMGDRSKGATAEIFNSKTLGLLTQFQLEVNNQWSSIIHDNKMDIKSGNKSGATVMFQLGQLAAFSFMFNNFMKSLTGSGVMIDPLDLLKKIFGKDDDEDKTVEERATEVLGEVLKDIPFVSFMNGGRIPISEAFKGATTLIKKWTNQTDKYGNKIKWDDVKKDIIESAYYWLLPTGYGQLKKTTKGLSMYDKNLPIAGSYTDSGNLRFTADESTGGKIKAALFGQYSSEEAQKYIDSGYNTIKGNNIKELQDLNMSSSEYVKYRKNLNAAGSTNYDKINYIVNSNYTKEQKNIMAKNLLKEDETKYNIASQITTNYYDYAKWTTEIKKIRDNTTNDKEETIKYINSLNLNIPQKALMIKMYYSSFNEYNEEIVNYINSKNIPIQEKIDILTNLKFTIKDGKVYW